MTLKRVRQEFRHPVVAAKGLMPKDPVAWLDNQIGTGATPGLSVDKLLKNFPSNTLAGVPIQAMADSQDYRSGKLTPKTFLARVGLDSVGWGVWGVGSAFTAAGLLGLGAPGFLAGAAAFAVGTLASTVWSRTGEPALLKPLAGVIPAGPAKAIANGFTRYVANPIFDHVIHPVLHTVMNHKILTGAIGATTLGLLAWRFPAGAKYWVKALPNILGRLAIGMGVATLVTRTVLDRFLPDPASKTSAAKG